MRLETIPASCPFEGFDEIASKFSTSVRGRLLEVGGSKSLGVILTVVGISAILVKRSLFYGIGPSPGANFETRRTTFEYNYRELDAEHVTCKMIPREFQGSVND